MLSSAVVARCYCCWCRFLLLPLPPLSNLAAATSRPTVPVVASRRSHQTCACLLIARPPRRGKGDGMEIASSPVAGLLCRHKQQPRKRRKRKTERLKKRRILEIPVGVYYIEN